MKKKTTIKMMGSAMALCGVMMVSQSAAAWIISDPECTVLAENYVHMTGAVIERKDIVNLIRVGGYFGGDTKKQSLVAEAIYKDKHSRTNAEHGKHACNSAITSAIRMRQNAA